ncbi:hypothetical protein KVR01_002941 [Diaporthe batatas]|uniref:uncharacterized protein n=1 Tax=Diaporthe batatas TaxID=748121 RepID=UPI001D057095|nr:uncharacterized protein KVR01_002941 [Diaporthe batatas]KAG8167252.1 hypothetical protein KVR01_002941 [Diaporthe batatas]
MVSFFGLKFGADKKRKEVEALQPPPPPPQWKNDRTEVLLQCSGLLSTNPSRPGTAHSSRSSARRPFAAGENRNSAANSIWDFHETEFRGLGTGRVASFASISAGSGPFIPGHGLKSFGSETNLQLSLGARNGSSTSLAAPRLPFGRGGGGAVGPRPGSAHSMRNGRERPWISPVDTSPVKESTPGIAGPQRSPLGQLELMSPVRSDSESLLGEDPEKFAQDISDRVTQEEKMARMRNELEERRRIQAELEATARRNSEASRPKTAGAYPSPPASVTSDYIVPPALVPGQRSGSFAGAAAREVRPASSGRDNPSSHQKPAPGPRMQDSAAGSMMSISRGRQPSVEGPQPSSSRSPLASVAPVVEDRSAIRARSQTADELSPVSSRPRAQPSREPLRGATVPAAMSQRSPLFQQSSPFDIHEADGPGGSEDGDEQPPKIDYRAANAPYGIPSPPLSNRQRTSEEAESRPVIRSVMAKRDTMVVGGPPRQSLGLQIDELEKTLQQAQTMAALEKGPSARSVSRSRGDSDGGSSNYSDISESPMTIEPPLVSPKPFPLTPRPTTPGARSNSYSRDVLQPTGRTLGARWEIQPGSVGSTTPTSGKQADQIREDTRDSPASRTRPTGAPPVKRPTVDEYGNVRVNAVASMANRIHRPSPDEYGVQIKRTESPFRTESPILKEVRKMSGTDTSSDGLSSNDTSRSNSPLPSHSHSVFSPPPPAKRAFPPRCDHGPAPTAPPTTPLPIPEKSARRRKAPDTPGCHPQEKTIAMQSPASTPLSRSPGLASSASIIPDLASNPNWPLPAPDAPASRPVVTADGGFGARRSLLRDKRSAPAPLNIAATRFAEDTGGPWTPGNAGSESRPKTAGGERKGSLIRVDMEFEWKEEYSTNSLSRQQQQPAYQVSSQAAAGDGGSKAEAIGMARGLSLKYDQEREQQKRGRAKERMKLMRAWTIDETATSPTSPDAALAPGQPPHRTTGATDEAAARFI